VRAADAPAALTSPSATAVGEARPESLEAYFDRLDRAFAGLSQAEPAPTPLALAPEPLAVGPDGTVVPPSVDSAPAEAPPASLVDAFAALLAAEQQTPIAPPAAAAVASGATLDDRTIDAIAERVLARVTDAAMRPAVLEVAERLVREEIERLKAQP
jgi:hypothetical protein